MEVLVSDGGGASLPFSSNANQLPNELSMVREWKSWNFSPSAKRVPALVGDQPRVEVGGVVVAVQRGPLVLDALDGPEQLGAAEAVELALGQREAVLPGEEVVDVLRADAVA